MGILTWIVLGLIAGAIAKMIDPRPNSGSIIWTIILGIVGALIGGWIGGALFGLDVNGFNLESLFTATVGALLVLFIAHYAGRNF